MSVPVSIFDQDGLDVGSNSRNLTYLYGLADFFAFSFEDQETINLMLEAGATSASEIYSNFLQLTSTLSLETIQTRLGVGIKLILIQDTDQVGSLPKYKVNLPVFSAKYLANRPFLPTELLESGVDFRVVQSDTSSCTIQFSRPISEYKFSKRPVQNGADGESQYAIWVTDAEIDAQLMTKHFGNLLGLAPEVSSDQFSNLVYGLYYLYNNGPTLKILEQGLNLVLGIPMARATEQILDVRNYLESDQYLVIAETNQYLLPTGIVPVVAIGDTVELGQPIAKWIEVKDYISDGAWWLNVSIPRNVISIQPSSQQDRFAAPGTYFDRLMAEYLYRNTFLIRINVGPTSSADYFDSIFDILTKAKPAQAQPIYVWRVLIQDDNFLLSDEQFDIIEEESDMLAINTHPIDVMVIN